MKYGQDRVREVLFERGDLTLGELVKIIDDMSYNGIQRALRSMRRWGEVEIMPINRSLYRYKLVK